LQFHRGLSAECPRSPFQPAKKSGTDSIAESPAMRKSPEART
jgi:hypothetical protein